MKTATQQVEKNISVANTVVVARRLRRSTSVPGCEIL